MKTNATYFRFVLLVSFTLLFLQCQKSPFESRIDTDYLLNVSFEKDHTPTLAGWRFGNPQLAKLVNDAPPKGGNWSLQLTADWAPTSGFVYRPITNVKSGDIVRLSAFVRATKKFGGKGIIMLNVGPNYYTNNSKSSFSSDTVWNQIFVIDTLKLEPGDTLWVILSATNTEIVPFQQLFDLVQLEKINR
ncbi:MAG: hypothetical protein Kow0037_19400 [Calditrichia bacterium]